MVSVANSLVILIDTYYGYTGQGGTKPTTINLLDNKRTPPFPPHTESIVIWLPVKRSTDPTNTDYATIKYELSVHMATPESDDRLKTITDEVRRVVNTYAISYINVQSVGDEEDVSDRRLPQYKQVFMVTLEQNMFPSTIAWSTSTLDENAIHDNEAAEINAIAEKGTPVDGDIVIIEDSADSWNKKKALLSNLPGGGAGVTGSGTQWTLPVWDTTSTIGDSMISQNAGGTAAVIGGSVTVNTIVAGVADYDKFLVSDTGLVKFRTGAEAYADMDGYVDADAEAVITAELVDGQSIDLAIDALILTHKNLATAHQDAPGLIATHTSDDNAHHEVFEAADFTTAFAAESLANLTTRAHGNLSDAPTDAHHDEAHVMPSTGPHSAVGLTVGWVIAADSATTFSWQAPAGGADPNAIHDNVANEIQVITSKGSPVGADVILIEDSADSWNKKSVAITNLPAGSPSFGIPTGDIDIGDSAVEGTSGDSTRADHQHAFTAPGAGYPLDTANTEADGSATTPARSDHVHRLGSHLHTATAGEGGTLTWTNALAVAAAGSHDHSDNTKGDAVPESSITFSATGHDHDGSGSENVDYTNLDNIPASFTPAAHVLATSGPHTDTLPVTDIANGTQYQILKAGASQPAWSDEVITKGGNVMSPAVGYYHIWVAPFDCTVTTLRGIQKGGTSTVVNARIDGTDQVATADLTLTSADTPYETSTLTSTTVVTGDHIEIEVVTVGSATQILIQLDVTRP